MDAETKERALRKLKRSKRTLKASNTDPERLTKVRKAIRRIREEL